MLAGTATGHAVTTGKAHSPDGRHYQWTAQCTCGWDTVNAMPAGLQLEIGEHVNPGSARAGTRPRRRPGETTTPTR